MTSSTVPASMLFFIREQFPPTRVDIVRLFGVELVGRGLAVDFAMPSRDEAEATRAITWHGRTTYLLPSRLMGRGGVVTRQIAPLWHHVACLLGRVGRRYAAVQYRDEFVTAALGLIVARLRGQRYFFWLSFPYPEDDRIRAADMPGLRGRMLAIRGRLTGFLAYRWIMRRADHCFVQSDRMLEDMVERGVARDRLTAVPMGVAIEELVEPAQASAGEEDTLIYVGTLNAHRQLGILIDALVLLRRHRPRARLILVGDADLSADRVSLEDHARRAGVADAVEFTGLLPRPEVVRRIRAAAVCVSPIAPIAAFTAASPTKLFEYMAQGKAVIANDHPEQSRVLREARCGLRVAWSARQFARAAAVLLATPAAGRLRLGRQGLAWVARYRTYDRIADSVMERYREVLSTEPFR